MNHYCSLLSLSLWRTQMNSQNWVIALIVTYDFSYGFAPMHLLMLDYYSKLDNVINYNKLSKLQIVLFHNSLAKETLNPQILLIIFPPSCLQTPSSNMKSN